MGYGHWPGFVIDNTTIAVDYWPKKPQLNVTHSFLTHCHSDHTQNLDKTWNGSTIYCSKITKKLLIDLKQIKSHYIHELEMNQTHVLWVGESSFNVTLLDANHCLGAVMYLFESDLFGLILATGDFRYSPDMFSPDSLLVNREIEMCYLDNTYFDRATYSNIPSRKDALGQIKDLIEIKKKIIPKEHPEAKVIFKIILKTLGKEELLIELAEHFKTKIVCSKFRYNRYVKVLELDKKYFSLKFELDSFIFVQDNDEENIDQIEGLSSIENKHFIIIEPSALLPDPNRPIQARKLTEYYTKSLDTYFRVPYSDHSSYLEIIEFIRKLKPKRVLPIVRKPMPNNVKTDDLSFLDRYLSFKPLIDTKNCYRYLLEAKGVKSLSSPHAPLRKSNIPTKSHFRSSIKKRQGIEYESPEKGPSQSSNKSEELDDNVGLVLRSGRAKKNASSDKENKDKSDESMWEKVGDLVDIRAVNFSQSEHDISSRNMSLNTTPVLNNSSFKSMITRSKSPKKLNEINISNHENSTKKSTPVHSKIKVQSTAQRSKPNTPSKMTPQKENIINQQSPVKQKLINIHLLPESSNTSSDLSVVIYKTPLKKVISSLYESCESLKENAESSVPSLKTKSPSLRLNLSGSTNGRDKNSISPQKKENELNKEMQEFDLDFSENNESKIKRRESGSLESIIIEHTESDEISNVNLLNEEKNLEIQFSKKIDDNFETCEKIPATKVNEDNCKNKEIMRESVNEFLDFYDFFDKKIEENSHTSDEDKNDVQSCSKLIHEWVLASFEF